MSERCAIVGSGLASLTAFATLRRAGVAASEIVVVGPDDDPTRAWRGRAAAIRQQRMRSESDGHVAAATFPGLAVQEALRRRDAGPLVESLLDRYHPTVEDFLAHADRVRERSGWDSSHRPGRVERIRAVDGGFELDGEGPFAHVLVATGHPGLARPPELALDPRAVHAYEPHEYAGTVAVVGAGMAAATEWLNALATGADVVSIRRREPLRRPLNLPRPLFSKRGLSTFHRTSHGQRAAMLRDLGAPSYPRGKVWDRPLEEARREGRFTVAAELNGCEQVICATGFRRGFEYDPLLARLVSEHGLETCERWIVLDPDSTVPSLTDASRTLALAGVAGQWAFPGADTVAGARYAAHGFARRVCRTR